MIENTPMKTVKQFYTFYLVERDFYNAIKLLDEKLVWIGTGENQMFFNLKETETFLNKEFEVHPYHFDIEEEYYKQEDIDENTSVVYGEMEVYSKGMKVLPFIMQFRFSIVCVKTEENWVISNVHQSIGSIEQLDGFSITSKTQEKYDDIIKQNLDSFNAIFSVYQGGLIISDKENYMIKYCNELLLNKLGVSKSNLYNKHNKFYLLKNDEDEVRLKQEIQTQLNDSKKYIIEYEMIDHNGNTLNILENGAVATIGNNGDYLISVLMDITRQKEAEFKLKQMYQQVNAVYDNVEFGIMIFNLSNNDVTYINNKALDMLGYTRKEFFDSSTDFLSRITKTNTKEESMQKQSILNENKGAFCYKSKVLKKDGSMITIYICVTVMKQDQDMVEVYTLQDITEEEIIKEKIIEQNEQLVIGEQKYQIAISRVNAMIYEHDLITDTMILPKEICEKFDIPSIIQEATHSNLWEKICHPSSLETFNNKIKQIKDGNPHVEYESLYYDKNGNDVWLSVDMTTVFNNQKQPIRVITILQDVTQRKNLLKENQYQQALFSNNTLVFEASVSLNTIQYKNSDWFPSNCYPLNTYQDMAKWFIQTYFDNRYIDEFKQKLCPEFILKEYNKGLCQFNDEVQLVQDGTHKWYLLELVAVEEEFTSNVLIRCYLKDINDSKLREEKINNERKFYESMFAKSSTIFEFNYSKDSIVKGIEIANELIGTKDVNRYSQFINECYEFLIHAEDQKTFIEQMNRNTVIYNFDNHQNEMEVKVRIKKNNEYRWVSIVTHLFKEQHINELMGFCYVQDIHEDKLKELELIYQAEHDLLTKLYNKHKTQQAIDEYLTDVSGTHGNHAFFILDLDNFKDVNDSFGHAFGDVVISKISSIIKEIFREDDIVGRIGGDEFVILMKHTPNQEIIMNKAIELLRKISDSYGIDGNIITIAASIGISMYPKDGLDFNTLYQLSDIALYQAKNYGKGQFVFYENTMDMINSSPKIIDEKELLEDSSFEDDISDHIFKILYETPNKISSFGLVLNLLGKHFNMDKCYICEKSLDGFSINNTARWILNESMDPKYDAGSISVKYFDDHEKFFNEDGILYIANIDEASEELKAQLKDKGIYSILQFAIYKNNQFFGMIGYEYFDKKHAPSKKDITKLKTISNMLAVFILEQRAFEEANRMKAIAMTIVDTVNTFMYIVKKDTYEIVLMNDKVNEAATRAEIGSCCYKVLRNQTNPCSDCPMHILSKENTRKTSIDIFNEHLNIHTCVTTSWVEWIDGTEACLLNCAELKDPSKD